MKLYKVDVRVYATAYIKAKSAAEARTIAKELQFRSPAVPDSGGDVPFSDLQLNDPDLPAVSLSPAMTIHGVDDDSKVERAG